jgi:aspartate aminotransferase-like enzyme
MNKAKEGIQPAFQTRNDLPLTVSTSGCGGLRGSVPNLIEPRNVILTAVHGLWGQTAADLAI